MTLYTPDVIDHIHVTGQDLVDSDTVPGAPPANYPYLDPVDVELEPTALGKRPAGATGVFAAAAVIIAAKLGLELSAEDAATLIAALVGLVSLFSPQR